MAHAQRIDEVRRQVRETFAGLQVRQPETFRESILIRDGSYCGRRFEAEGAYAVWFLEEDEIKFYQAPDGATRLIEPVVQRERIAA